MKIYPYIKKVSFWLKTPRGALTTVCIIFALAAFLLLFHDLKTDSNNSGPPPIRSTLKPDLKPDLKVASVTQAPQALKAPQQAPQAPQAQLMVPPPLQPSATASPSTRPLPSVSPVVALPKPGQVDAALPVKPSPRNSSPALVHDTQTAPILQSPEFGHIFAENKPIKVFFEWNAAQGATSYRIIISRGNRTLIDQQTAESHFRSTPLPKGVYIWTLRSNLSDIPTRSTFSIQ